MSPRGKRDYTAAVLAAYCAEVARYRAQWGIPPDREVHLTAWANAKAAIDPRNYP